MSQDFSPLLMPQGAWPRRDHALWAAGLAEADPLDGPAYAASLRPKTVYFAERGYSRWLSVLAAEDALDDDAEPCDRVTPANMRRFLAALRVAGNTNNTITARLWGLRSALRIMYPDRDFQWLTLPNGDSINRLLPTRRRPRWVPDMVELFEWGLELVDTARAQPCPAARCTGHRNGLMIAVLAARAPRLRSLAAMRIGHHITVRDDTYHVAFEHEDLKVNKPLAYDLPARLMPIIDRYLAVERIGLLNGSSHDSFWVGQGGRPLSTIGIEVMIRRASMVRFGHAFGPHVFRRALATTIAKRDPRRAGAASAILGNSAAVVEKYYNFALRADAVRRRNVAIEQDRAETYQLAQELFAERY